MIIIAGTLSISLLLEHKQYILSWNLIIIRVISEFTIGILIFIMYKNSNIKITYITLLNNLSFIGIIILPFIIENSIFDFLYIILFCILIFTSSYNCTGLVNYILNHQYIKYLGKISYTIYIIHIPCLIITKVLMQYILNKYEILSSYQNILIIIPVIFIILISNFLYNNIEKYCQEYIKNILK